MKQEEANYIKFLTLACVCAGKAVELALQSGDAAGYDECKRKEQETEEELDKYLQRLVDAELGSQQAMDGERN